MLHCTTIQHLQQVPNDGYQQRMSYGEIKRRLMSAGAGRGGSLVERGPGLALKEGLICSKRKTSQHPCPGLGVNTTVTEV